MPAPQQPPWSRLLAVATVALIGLSSVAAQVAAQPAAQEPGLAEQEAQLEAAFAAALAASDAGAEPLHQLQAWGVVMVSSTMLEARRRRELGEGLGPEEASEAILERWRRLRPDAAGPDLFRLFQIQDFDQRAVELLGLGARYPDDPLLLWQIGQTLRSVGQSEQVSALLEEHATTHPSSAMAWRLLADHYRSLDNNTRVASALRRWAAAIPGDPRLLSRWLDAGLDRLEPDQTARMVDDLLAARPVSAEALATCARLARSRGSELRDQLGDAGRACVARHVAEAEAGSSLSQRATGLLAELAAAEGDWSGMVRSLEALAPEPQMRALLAAARSLEAPARCSQRLELLRVASDGAIASHEAHSSIASAARGCAGRTGARELFIDLLERAPADQAMRVVGAWAFKVNGEWRGELPVATAAVLEERLAQDPEVEALYRALDVVYQLADDGERQLDLLRRFERRLPDSLRAEQVITLVFGLLAEGEDANATALLEARLERSFSPEEAELLWHLLAEPPRDDFDDSEAAWEEARLRADRFAARLIASVQPSRVAFGHVLAARGAASAGDRAVAERHYLEALRTSTAPREEWAVEMLVALAEESDSGRLAALAVEVCEQTWLEQRHRGTTACATSMLAQAGLDDAASSLAELAGKLPADPRALESLAFEAQGAGQANLAERAWRRLVEVDPSDGDAWVHLGVFLEKAGRSDELESTLLTATEVLGSPPVDLLRSVGRERTSRGLAADAIEVLQQARAALPQGHDPAWIDAELRQAYAVLGYQNTAAAIPSTPVRAPGDAAIDAVQLTTTAPADLLAAAEALRSGAGGRYDPAAAEALFERAAAAREPLATYRLALVRGDRQAVVEPAILRAVEARAEAGDGYARYLLGTGALMGIGQRLDLEAARRWLQLAAEQDQLWAHHNLAWMAQTGQGVPRDLEAALDGYRRAGDLGNVVSLYDFAQLALSPSAFGPPCVEGRERLERAATAGHDRAAAFLGKLLLYGRGNCVQPAPESARRWLERGAEAASPGAKFDLGLALLLGEGGGAEPERGLALIAEVTALPDGLALETLAWVRASGAFAARDPARARALLADAERLGASGFDLLRREARYPPFERLLRGGASSLERLVAAGDMDAASALAALLLEGPFPLRDEQRGVELARRAAQGGDPRAMRLLAEALLAAKGGDRNPAASLRWLRRAAAAEDPSAMHRLGLELLSGERVAPDLRAGVSWITRAAERGHWQAVGELARIYAEGRPGIPADPERAAAWKLERAELGDTEARGWLLAHGYSPPPRP